MRNLLGMAMSWGVWGRVTLSRLGNRLTQTCLSAVGRICPFPLVITGLSLGLPAVTPGCCNISQGFSAVSWVLQAWF